MLLWSPDDWGEPQVDLDAEDKKEREWREGGGEGRLEERKYELYINLLKFMPDLFSSVAWLDPDPLSLTHHFTHVHTCAWKGFL